MRRLTAYSLAAAATFFAASASAFPQFLTDWRAHYPASTASDDANCQLCHAGQNGGSPWNAYGWDMVLALESPACDSDDDATVSSTEALDCIAFFNSDEDLGEADNAAEIAAGTQPGWSEGDCNRLFSDAGTLTGQTAPAGIGPLDAPGIGPVTGCDDGGGPDDPGGAAIVTVRAGESIQAALDAVGPGSTLLIEPGVYNENPGGQNALNVTKSGIRLIGLGDDSNGVTIQNAGGQRNGIVVVPQNRTDCTSCHSTLAPPFSVWPGIVGDGDMSTAIQGFEIRNITIAGFDNNGLFTERVDDFTIVNVHSVDNKNYGIFPTLSSNGIIQHSSAVGADDSGIWVETSTDVRVTDNLVDGNVNGFEVSNSDRITLENNIARNNTVGISLFTLTDLVHLRPTTNKIIVRNNHVHDNNKLNTGTPGSLLAELPRGTGILVLGVDNSVVEDNLIENNNFFGIAIADYCLGVQGTSFDCLANPPPPEFDPIPERNIFRGNVLNTNGTAPDPSPFAPFAADITLFVQGDYGNCFSDNTFTTFIPITTFSPCTPVYTPPLISPGSLFTPPSQTAPVVRPGTGLTPARPRP